MLALGYILGLVGFVCWIIVLIHAFTKGGIGWGLGSFCLFPVAWYYGIAKFQHDKKTLIVGGMILGQLLGTTFQLMGTDWDAMQVE